MHQDMMPTSQTLCRDLALSGRYGTIRLIVVGVAEWLRHLVVAQKTVGSNPTAHPDTASRTASGGSFYLCSQMGTSCHSPWLLWRAAKRAKVIDLI